MKLTSSIREIDFKRESYAIAIEVSYYSGFRISEVLALQKNDIDFNENIIGVYKMLQTKGLRKKDYYLNYKLKSKASKANLPLATPLKHILLDWFDKNPFEKIVTDENGDFINPDVLSNDVRPFAKEMGISWHFHMLRHTYCTNLVKGGVDLKTAQELIRHANINTTISVYTHVNESLKLEALNNVFSSSNEQEMYQVTIYIKSRQANDFSVFLNNNKKSMIFGYSLAKPQKKRSH